MTNHNPTITSGAATGSFSEDANTTGSTVDHVLAGTMNFTDSDSGDTHTTTAALKTAVWSGGSTLPTGALAKFQAGLTSTIVTDSNTAGKLKWTFSEDDRDFDFLAKNETLVLTYEVTLKDNHGGSTKQTVKITITGTDDVPVFATTTGATLSEQANKSLSLSSDTAHIALQFTDVDLNNTGHTACVLSVSATGNTSGILPGSFGTAELMSFFEIDNVVKNAGSSNGVVNTTFSAPDLSFDYLAAGEQIQITYVVQIDDKKGGLSTQNVTVTVNGTNDKPVVLAFPESAHLTEDHNLSSGNLVASGDFWFSDLDLSDTHSVSTTVTATRSGGGTVPISDADLIAAFGAIIDPDSTSQLLGEVDWSFALDNNAVGFLAEGETLTLNYHVTVTDSSGASDTQEICITVLGINKPVVTKTASVPGGTANAAGEVISYTITVANDGHSALTGVTVTDPSVSNLAPVLSGGFNAGDTNHDNKLSAGETWQYTASHTVTQEDISSNGGGDGTIENTVTVDTAETLPVTATATVVVENGASIAVTKTADVASVNAAGNVIHYAIAVSNTGNTAVAIAQVTDPQVNIVTPILDYTAPVPGAPLLTPKLNGDYNVGDTNQNGFQDSGETFVYVNAGDTDQNGTIDPGETAVFTNIGDTNQNGFEDPGEHFQFYNAGDTNHNGVQDSGETFQFDVSHAATPVTDSGGLNVGDTNHNSLLDLTETWQFTVAYTVTQADIDNGGVVAPSGGLTHDNTVTVTTDQTAPADASTSVTIVQNPAYTVVKSVTDVGGDGAGGHVNAAGDVISYSIALHNTGNMTLTGVSLSDPLLTGMHGTLSAVTESISANGKLDVGETWTYTGTYTAQQADINNNGGGDGDIDNTATAHTAQLPDQTSSTATPIDRNPAYSILKTVTDVGGDGAGGHVNAAGDVISYNITVSNTGNVDLAGVSVTDALLQGPNGTFSAASGDTVNPGVLDVGETWTYTGTYTAQQADLDNNGGGDGDIDNTATVHSSELADQSSSTATPVDAGTPSFTFEVNALGYHDNNNNNVADSGDVVDFAVDVHNTGTVTLTNVSVVGTDGRITYLGIPIPSLGIGVTDSTSVTGSHLIQGGTTLDETQVGQSDQVGNVLFEVHLSYASLMAL